MLIKLPTSIAKFIPQKMIGFIGIIAIIFCSLQQSLSVLRNDTLSTTASSGAGAECRTPDCMLAAAQLLEKMDTNVNPCDDFYQFTCGGFLNKTLLRGNEDSVTLAAILEQDLHKELRNTLEEPSPSSEIKPFKLAKNLYRSCMNTTAIETQSVKRLLEDLKKLGGWPVLEGDSWNETNFDWIQSIYKLRDLGYESNQFFDSGISVDYKNKNKPALYLAPLQRDAFRTFKIRKQHPDHVMNIVRILGGDVKSALGQVDDATKFEWSLAMLHMQLFRANEIPYQPTTIVNLTKLYPRISWQKFFTHFFRSPVEFDNSNLTIYVNHEYLSKLMTLMAETPKRIQANYLMWRVVENSLSYLNEEIREQHFQWQGIPERETRWKECVKIVSEKLPMSVGFMYAGQYSSEEAQQKAISMMNHIKEQFKGTLEEIDWMDNETRKTVLKELAVMPKDIGYPNEFIDDSAFNEYYQDLELSDDHILEGILNITLFTSKSSFRTWTMLINRNDWAIRGKLTTIFTAFVNDEEKNTLYFPPSFLQHPYFNNGWPNYVNYGSAGSAIAHELIHGVDNGDQQVDQNKNIGEGWTPFTRRKYHEKSQCFLEQYGNYSIKELGRNLDGHQTLRENIADNGGYRQAYLAYKDWSARNGQEQRLPGLPYTPEQMFWISASSIYCEFKSYRDLNNQVYFDRHSPSKFRVLGALSNIPEFSEDFGCPVGSNMNRAKKCMMW